MGKKLSEDQIKWVLSVESSKAQQEVHRLTTESKSLSSTNKDLRKSMADLVAQGKKNSDEYNNLDNEIKKNNKTIDTNSKLINKLEDNMGDAALTMAQLRKRAKDLQQQLDHTSKSTHPEEYAVLEKRLGATRTRMDELKNSGKNVGNEFDFTSSMMSKLKAAAVAFITVKLGEYLGAIGMKAYETRKEFAQYEAVLRNTLGSQEKMKDAMKLLQNIAANSPGTMAEWTESYIKLVNRGIKPTYGELTNIGDIAASQGKSVDQFVEALLDAMTGENERLKEFGIRASKNGDIIKYTFKGQTTEVQNNDAAITKYILSLGKLQGVQGSMATQMKELGGMESNFGDAMDSTFNKLGKRFEGFFKNILSSGTKFVQDIGDVIEPISDQFETQFDKVVELEGSLLPLAERYDELTSKGHLTKQEHVELNTVINSIATTVPGAITAWDKYGNAIGISTAKVYEFINAEKARLRYMNKQAIADLKEQRMKIQKELTDDKISKYVKPTVLENAGSYGGTTTYRKRTIQEEEELNKRIAQNTSDLAGIDAQLAKISGDDIDRMVTRQVAETKAQSKARNDFMSMNKAKLSAWLKDEKNAASKYKDIAQEVYDSQFGSTAGGGSKKDKTDYNAVALKNMDTLHDEQINKIKLIGAEKEQTEDEINRTILESDTSYYQKRIAKLEFFISKEKDAKKKAAYENEVVNLKTKQINNEVALEKQRVSDLEKIRQDDLSSQEKIYKSNQAALENMLAEKKITKDQYDMVTLSLDVANTENRLQVEKQYLNDVNSLELKNGAIKADAIDKANEAVMSADLANAKARSAQQQKLNDLTKDFKDQFKLTTVGEDLALQMKVLESAYQARKEMAEKNNLDTAELDKAYAQAKQNLTQDSESRINQVRNQYGLLNQKQQFDLELQQLKQHLNDQTLTQEEYEKGVQNLKRDSYKKQFDYYSGLFSGAVQALQQAEMDNVDAKYDAEIAAAQGNAEEVERLENEKAKKKLDIEKKYADVNFAVKASQIIADTAVGIMKALAELGPIAGPIAAALMGITGAAQLASANAERMKVKNMTIGGSSSSSSSSGARVATGKEDGGSIDIVRAQDGKLFPGAAYDPTARGYIDKPTVIVGEGPSGRSREWVASNAAVSNPTVAPLLDIIDKSQRAGTIRTLDLNGVIRAKAAGYNKGGYIDNSGSGNNTQVVNPGSNIPAALIEKLTTVLTSIDENGVTAGVYLTDFEQKQALRNKSRKLGSKR